LVLALTFSIPAFPAERIFCYTTWDDSFFYVGVEVQDMDVVGTNSTHMSNPWEDDCIEVFIETDNAKAPNRTSNTFQMSVSAAGGSSWLVGDNGIPTPKKIFSFKYARKVQGTLNQSGDRDSGYTIELGMPWKEMGGPPQPGQVMGFNIVCRLKGENTGFVSLSPEVKTEEDIQCPAKWASIRFTNTPTIVAVQNGIYMCRKVLRTAPRINGNLETGEWIRDMRFQMLKPPPTKIPGPKYLFEKLSLTHYFYWYQGDSRKEAPADHVWNEDGSSALTDHPLDGVGPWFTHDRVQWHKDQLLAIREAGIDVITPVYWGAAENRKRFASKGLNCLVQALKELKAEGKSYPLVGMFFDTTAMFVQYGTKPDLTKEDVKATFYGMIKDFFLQIPDEFRASIQLPAEKGNYPAYIINLYTASWFSDIDPHIIDYCNKRFESDFGSKLIWIGHTDFKSKAVTLDGYSNYGAGLGPHFDDSGWIRIGAVGAGYDDSAVRGRTTPIRSRMEGESFKKDFDTVLSKSPDWLIIDGWNELHEGSEICPSSEYGDQYVSATKLGLIKFNGMRAYDARYLKHNIPTIMLPGAIYQATITVKNVGTKPWYQGVFLAGRWYKDGTILANASIRVPLQQTVLPGQTIEKTIGIFTSNESGKPLPEGEYELRIDLVRGEDGWFSNNGDTPLCITIKISYPEEEAFSLVSSTLPTLMKSGAKYTANIILRNDGSTTWKAGSTTVGYRLYKVTVDLGKDSQDEAQLLSEQLHAVTLDKDVPPGRTVELAVPVILCQRDGTPLPIWTQKDLWTYVIQWMVVIDGKPIEIHGIGHASESFKALADDYGPKFISSDTPIEMKAGKQIKVNVTLVNAGIEQWSKGRYSIGYHWYYIDGTEAVWDGVKTQLPVDVPPGGQITVRASVTPPPYDGQYYLVWDLADGDKWVSTTANSRGGDILVVPVRVVDGKLLALDLSKLFDSDVISFDTKREDGDSDGSRHTLPGEFVPPLVSKIFSTEKLWPCGLWTSTQGKGLDSCKRILFKYPSKADGAKNAISCNGQTIPVKPGKYSTVHLLAFATEETVGNFVLTYKSTSEKKKVEFSPWDSEPKHGEHAAFVCLHRHSPNGDERGQRCYLNHYIVSLNSSQDLISITLPENLAIKVIGITLEKLQ
jgi:hypothetical protein